MAAKTATPDRMAHLRSTMRHLDDCPVAGDVERAVERVEVYRTARPARQETRDGVTYAIPPQPLTVVHCNECGEMIYHKEPSNG